MISEANLRAIEALIAAHGGAEAPDLLQALRDVEAALAGQSILINRMATRILNMAANQAAFDQVMSDNDLRNTLASLGAAKRNSFSIVEVQGAVKELNSAINAGNDLNAILGQIVSVAKLFI